MTGRTLPRWTRVYIDGVNMSGYGRSIGPLVADFAPTDVTAPMGDTVKGFLPNQPNFEVGALNTVMDDTATVGPVAFNSAKTGTARHVLVAIGDRAAPAIGVPTFWGVFPQTGFEGANDGGTITCNIPFGGFDVTTAAALKYTQTWGRLLHPYGAETGANAANTNSDGGAQTTKGGIFVYHIYAIAGGAGTATVSVDESATGVGAWGALASATSGAIAFGSAPTAGYVQLTASATVKQYLRWQLTLAGGATGATFVCAFIRGQ